MAQNLLKLVHATDVAKASGGVGDVVNAAGLARRVSDSAMGKDTVSKAYDFPGFDECIKLIRSNDPMTFEDGYHLLLPKVKEFSEELIKLIEKETDPKIKPRFVELLGECEDEKYIPIFEKLLESEIHDVVAWSLTSLEKLSKGVKVAYDFRKNNPKWLE